ncbi:MAG: hypothetical protein K2H32_10145 [Muribaculaceae bacterium]|nr:hypothetical protein [Muribaculaceae bacterium]
MRKLALFLLLVSSIVHAAAGMADRFDEHQHWVFPAYAYCLLFGIIILLGLFIAMLVYKDRIETVTDRISSYLKKHPFGAILFIGVSLTIPVGIMGSVSWEILWFFAIFPFLGMLGLFPAVLLCKYPKEKYSSRLFI